MSFWGSLVLCRPSGDLFEVEAIVSRDESVTEIAQPGGDWRIEQCEDTALIEDAEASCASSSQNRAPRRCSAMCWIATASTSSRWEPPRVYGGRA
jgi:hypothetical protein